MFKLRILTIGKTKEAWLDQAIGEYVKRLKPAASFDWVLAKDDEQLVQLVQKEPSYICLDPQGKQMPSEEFSHFLMETLVKEKSRLTFVIGGAEGLPLSLKKDRQTISLSLMTFTHQLTRLVLCEQIYRAFEIAKGSQYHK